MGDSYDVGQVGRIVEVNGLIATVDLGGGTTVHANLAFVEAKLGDYVLVHAGYALNVLDAEEAERMLSNWR